MGEKTELYARLIEAIITKNEDKLSTSRIRISQKKISLKYPVFEMLSIGDNFEINVTDMPDTEDALLAFQDFLVSIYKLLAVLVGEGGAKERLKSSIKEFITKNWKKILDNGLDKYLNYLGPPKKISLEQLKQEESVQIETLFEILFTTYITDLLQIVTIPTFERKLQVLGKKDKLIGAIHIDKTGTVTIDHQDADPEAMAGSFSKVFDSFVDLSSFVFGPEASMKRATNIVTGILDPLTGLAATVRIKRHILKGGLAKRVTTYITGLDTQLEGGIPRGNAILIQVPSAVEKNLLMRHLIKKGVESSAAQICALSAVTPNRLRKEMQPDGIKIGMLEQKNLIKIVDWYSYKDERVVGVEQDGTVIKSSKDLTHLGMALDMAIKELSEAPTKRAVINVLSPALQVFNPKSVAAFLQAIKTKFKQQNITSYFFIEKGTHSSKVLAMIQQIMDGVFDIETSGNKFMLGVLSMRSTNFDTTYHELQMSHEDVKIVVKKRKSPQDYREEAEIALSHRKYEQALALFNKALTTKTTDKLWFGKGKALYMLKKRDEALECFKQVVTLNPSHSDAWYLIGKIHFKNGTITEAKESYGKAYGLKPTYEWYDKEKMMCSDCATELKKGSKVCYNCGKIFGNQDIDLFECPLCKAFITEDAKECPKCGALFEADEEVVEEKPAPPPAIEHPKTPPKKGGQRTQAAREKTGQPPTGRAPPQRAPPRGKPPSAKAPPRSKTPPAIAPLKGKQTAQQQRAAMLAQQKAQRAKASGKKSSKSQIDEGLIMEDDSQLLMALEKSLEIELANRNWIKSLEIVNSILENKQSEKNWMTKGYILTQMKRYPESIVAYKRVVEFNPRNYQVLFNIGYSLLNLGRYKESLKYFNKVLMIDPENEFARKGRQQCLDILKEEGG